MGNDETNTDDFPGVPVRVRFCLRRGGNGKIIQYGRNSAAVRRKQSVSTDE